MIGICLIFHDELPWQSTLLNICIDQIRRRTKGNFRIFGTVPGNVRATQLKLLEREIEVVDAPSERIRPVQREHGLLLERLIERAIQSDCSHIATFDADSWPIIDGWDNYYVGLLSRAAPVAAVVRTELGDNFPFACFTLFRSEFWMASRSSFNSYIPSREIGGLVEPTRPKETGSGILRQLVDEDLSFFVLERSNGYDPHPIMGGVYDNAVFHLGAGSRQPRFITDTYHYDLDGLDFSRRFADRMNAEVQKFLIDELVTDHDSIMAGLTRNSAALAPMLVRGREIWGPVPPETRSDSAPALTRKIAKPRVEVERRLELELAKLRVALKAELEKVKFVEQALSREQLALVQLVSDAQIFVRRACKFPFSLYFDSRLKYREARRRIERAGDGLISETDS
jgi:hypothetical protein